MATSSLMVVLTVIGSVASVIALLISAPGKRSKIVHVVYALALTAVASSAVSYSNRLSAAQKEIAEINRIELEAQAILNSSDRTTEGSMAGFMLAGLAFLEKYKTRFPETYARAVKICESSGLYERSQEIGMEHFRNLQQGSGAMYYLLTGIAASNRGSSECGRMLSSIEICLTKFAPCATSRT